MGDDEGWCWRNQQEPDQAGPWPREKEVGAFEGFLVGKGLMGDLGLCSPGL